MFELDPESSEVMAFYRANLERHKEIADRCGIPQFSSGLRIDLAQLLPDEEAVRLVECVTRVGDFGNVGELVLMRRAVSRLHAARGVRMPRGKRTAPGLREFVERVAPVLLALRVPLATGGRSKLVRALQMIAIELEISGDPRDELRRLKRQKDAMEIAQGEVLEEAFAAARKFMTPPNVNPP